MSFEFPFLQPVQVVDVLECALFSNWESSIELSPSPRRTRKTAATPSEPRFDVEYWMRMRGEESRRGGCRGSAMLALTAFLDRADGTRPSQRAALLRFLRRAVADNTLAEFNRILDELEPLEVNVARSHAFAIPDQMVAEMSRVYAKVFQVPQQNSEEKYLNIFLRMYGPSKEIWQLHKIFSCREAFINFHRIFRGCVCDPEKMTRALQMDHNLQNLGLKFLAQFGNNVHTISFPMHMNIFKEHNIAVPICKIDSI